MSISMYAISAEGRSDKCTVCGEAFEVVDGVLEGRNCSACHTGRYHHFCSGDLAPFFDLGPGGEFKDGEEV